MNLEECLRKVLFSWLRAKCSLIALWTQQFFLQDNDLLPITNDDNYIAALRNARPLLRLVIQREGEFYDDHARAKSGTILGTFLGKLISYFLRLAN
jgi:hypothetical protein